MKTMKQVLEDLITTANFGNPSNLVGTRTPTGGFAKPSIGAVSKPKGKWKLKKKAQVNNIQRRTMNPDPKHPGSPFAISPAEWGE